MREFIKLVCVLLIATGGIAAPIAWTDDKPNAVTWSIRLGGLVVVAVGVLLFLRVHFCRDVVPDFLHRLSNSFFDRGGFCFAFDVKVVDGVCLLNTYFQNRHAGRCHGKIALRPARGFFMSRPTFEAIGIVIDCEPAAFGVARVPIPVPASSQAKRMTFEVGASVDYPDGKGRVLRFRDGIVLRTNSNFGNAFGTSLAVAGLLTGQLVLATPATITLELPAEVAEDVPADRPVEVQTFWRLGDPLTRGTEHTESGAA
jgi:hypothetical protein